MWEVNALHGKSYDMRVVHVGEVASFIGVWKKYWSREILHGIVMPRWHIAAVEILRCAIVHVGKVRNPTGASAKSFGKLLRWYIVQVAR